MAFGVLAVESSFAVLMVFRFAQVAWLQGGASASTEAVINTVPPDRRDQTRAFIYGGPTQVGRGGDDAPLQPMVREHLGDGCVRRCLRAEVDGELPRRRVRLGEGDDLDLVDITEGSEMEAPHPAETDEYDGQRSGHGTQRGRFVRGLRLLRTRAGGQVHG